MSKYVVSEEGEPYQIASNTGWRQFCQWAEGQETPTLSLLIDQDWCQEAQELRNELKGVLPSCNDPNIRSVGEELLNHLSGDEEIVIISNGVAAEPSPTVGPNRLENR